jgi:hypothetical protein
VFDGAGTVAGGAAVAGAVVEGGVALVVGAAAEGAVDGVLVDGVLVDGVLVDGVLVDGVLVDGVLVDGVLVDGVLVDGVLVDGVEVDEVLVDEVLGDTLLDGCELTGAGSVTVGGRIVGAGVEPSIVLSGRAAIRVGPFGERLSTGSGRFRLRASPSIEPRSAVGVTARRGSAPRDPIGEATTNSHATMAVAVIRIAEVMLTQRHPCLSNRIGKPCRRSTLILTVSFGVSNYRRGRAERKTIPEVGERR